MSSIKNITIKDVAKKAGVSIGTVSRVFNNYSDISAATKEKVLKIAKEMDYSPNLSAKSLSSKKNKNIALILNDLEVNRKVSLPLDIIAGVYQFTEEFNYDFHLIPITSNSQNEKTLSSLLVERHISGAIIQGLKIDDPYLDELENLEIPTVLIDINLDNQKIGSVSIDNTKASEQAVEYLVNQGHTNIAMINGRREAAVSIDREEGYIKGLKKNNIPVKTEYIQYANYNEQIAYFMALDLLENYSEVTAFFCASDLMAIGVIQAIKHLDLKIPEDISVMGFDNIPISEYTTPSITTVSQDMKLIGYEAAKLIEYIILDENTDRHIYVPHEIIVRESTRKINTGDTLS